MQYLTPDQLAKLLEVYKDPERRLFLRILSFTGCRVSEALVVTPRDLEAAERVLTLPALKLKTGGTKRVVLDAETARLMELFIRARTIRKDQRVFSFNRWQAWKLVRDAGEKIGVPDLHPHTLRHTFAVNWAKGGADLLKLQRQLGHKKLETTTDMYIHFATEDIREDYDSVFKPGVGGTPASRG